MAACHTMSKIPSRVENLFLNLENKLSPNGIYGVNFYLLGVPHTVIIDDFLPLTAGNTAGTFQTYFAGISPDSALWVPLLEKAFAKLYGNYAHIQGGDPRQAVSTMTGAPYDINYHGKAGDLTVDQLWTKLWDLNKAGDIIMGGTPSGSDTTTNSVGIV